jgi:hypothetical protein
MTARRRSATPAPASRIVLDLVVWPHCRGARLPALPVVAPRGGWTLDGVETIALDYAHSHADPGDVMAVARAAYRALLSALPPAMKHADAHERLGGRVRLRPGVEVTRLVPVGSDVDDYSDEDLPF